MATERESVSVPTPVQYNVGGNTFRAYFDDAHELLFVIDDTITADKPNVMLILSPVPGRKWDDILSREYGVDLETVRPRRDNKYQKLDIEYTGLDVYRELVHVADTGDDWTAALGRLARFRIDATQRAATERLNAATDTAAKARDTITRTNDVIAELQARLRELRAKLKRQRAMIGREPTKQSAAKILKLEAQIDSTGEKLARAKKRLSNAQRRLVLAEKDAEIARDILARNDSSVHVAYDGNALPVTETHTTAVTKTPDDYDDEEIKDEDSDYNAIDDDDDVDATEFDDADVEATDDDATDDDSDEDVSDDATVSAFETTDMPHFTSISFNNDNNNADNEEEDGDPQYDDADYVTDNADDADDIDSIDDKDDADDDENITYTQDANITMPAPAQPTPALSAPTTPIAQEIIEETEPRTEEMAEKVKPLFDKDPEILDEEIAFKPIDFEVRTPSSTMPQATTPVHDAAATPTPLSFVPPSGSPQPSSNPSWDAPAPDAPQPDYAPRDAAPVLDTITPVDMSNIPADTYAPAPDFAQPASNQPASQPAPGVQPATPASTMPQAQQPWDVADQTQHAQPTETAPQPAQPSPMPDVAVAPVGTNFRPTSPINGRGGAAARPVAPGAKKPALAYYILLIILIVLSVFTLWFYQKSTRDGTPDLTTTVAQQIKQAQPIMDEEESEPTPSDPDVFITTTTNVVQPEPEPEPIPVAPIPEPEPEPEPEPIPVAPTPEPVLEPIPIIPEVEDTSSPFLPTMTTEPTVEEEPQPAIPTEDEILARKPAYNVSQQDNMFVADENYVTDKTATAAQDETVTTVDVIESSPATAYVATEVVEESPIVIAPDDTDDEITCSGGGEPDMYGCCPGETYADVDGEGMCCVGDECFPPM